jgi:hypothetical protein
MTAITVLAHAVLVPTTNTTWTKTLLTDKSCELKERCTMTTLHNMMTACRTHRTLPAEHQTQRKKLLNSVLAYIVHISSTDVTDFTGSSALTSNELQC